MSQLRIGRLSRRQGVRLLAAFALANALVLLGTLVSEAYAQSAGAPTSGNAWAWYHLFRQFSLAPENVLAVWYASLQLFAVAVMALLCLVEERCRRAVGAVSRRVWSDYGWLGLAALFFLFSLDELGSLHERIGSLTVAAQPRVGWTLLLTVLAGAGGASLAFAAVHLRRYPVVLILMVTGVLLFATVPLQEVAERSMKHAAGTAPWNRPLLFTLLEEGTELVATYCFLTATALYASAGRSETRAPVDINVRVSAVIALVLVLSILMAAAQVFVWYAPSGDAGRPNNWFASVAAALAACASLRLKPRRRRKLYATLALVSLSFSVYVGANLYGYLHYETYRPGVEHVLTAGRGVLALSILVLGGATAWQTPARWGRLGVVVWALLLAAVLVTDEARLVAPLTSAAFAVLLPALWLEPNEAS